MKIFFAGIIQGSHLGTDIHAQNYRETIKDIVRSRYPDIELFDPFEGHEMSVHYNDEQARQTFFKHLNEVYNSDLLIAYLPQASLGTSIEVWEAYNRGIPVISISPMTTNWIIRFLPRRNFETIERFKQFIDENDIRKLYSKEVQERV